MRVLHRETRARFAAAGAVVEDDTMMVRLDPEMVMATVGSAPSEFDLAARNPAKSLHIGGQNVVFSAVGGPAFCSDLDRGRRAGTYADQIEFLKLVQSFDVIHQEGGGPFEALDLPADTRHLDFYLAAIRHLDKNWQGIALGRERVDDAIEMLCIAAGTDRAALAGAPALMAIINTNSPLTLDIPMAEGTVALAEAGQATCITPFTLAGAMAPTTLAGALTLQNAEVLFGVALTQLVRPGAPVIYGSFTSNVDLRSGSPAFGTPEYAKAAHAGGQLARRYGLPFRSSNTTASNSVDAQAVYESAMSLWGAVMGGANLVNHAAGWLEGGLTASYEKLVVDAEMLQSIVEYLQPIPVSADTLAVEAIQAVGPGGHFFGSAHTMERYETAFYASLLSEQRTFEAWHEGGRLEARDRANLVWKKLVAEYEQPSLPDGVDEALTEYVNERKREIEKR
jgi:trimethylamine--corrinoid protein Co-methyltransferase